MYKMWSYVQVEHNCAMLEPSDGPTKNSWVENALHVLGNAVL
jgi:hypothetical protein